MNRYEDVLDPFLSTQFAKRFQSDSEKNRHDKIEGRELYYHLQFLESNPEILPLAFRFVSNWLFDAERSFTTYFVPDYHPQHLKTVDIQPLEDSLRSKENQYACVKQTTAILLTQPDWLQNISPIVCCQNEFSIQLMSIYLQIIKQNKEDSDLKALTHSLILACGGKTPILYSYSAIRQSEILSGMFDFAAVQTALSHFPRTFFPEILGFTRAYCQTPTLIEICFPDHQFPLHFFEQRNLRLESQLPFLISTINDYLDFFAQQKVSLWQRIQRGFWLYQLLMQRARDQFNKKLQNPLTPQQAIARLFQKKKLAAIGHHKDIELKGKSLDTWFSEMPQNNDKFLKALAESKYVNRENPATSPLLQLFQFKGPMFGVLDDSELKIVKKWLEESVGEAQTQFVNDQEISYRIKPTNISFSFTCKYKSLSDRELYFYLLNADLFPDVLPLAKNKVTRLLRLCRFFKSPPFKHYCHEQFESWIDQGYQREMAAYKPLQGKPKISREAYIWGIEQIAPMILIDGCWLQHSLSVKENYPKIADILFKIYCDEIGNGRLEQNHPHIFQKLLNSLEIKLPPAHSKAFVEHHGFIDSAFDLPTFMLALSCHSRGFLPELLGLNMAIEVSGLGKDYIRLVDDWNYWGIDPEIASIHISIDNIASGHTFLAKKAIQIYMDDVLHRTGDYAILDRHWRRIYSGYVSLRFVGTRFKLGLPIWYLIHKFVKPNKQ